MPYTRKQTNGVANELYRPRELGNTNTSDIKMFIALM